MVIRMVDEDRSHSLAEGFQSPVHFVGIGGYGMSGLALVLHAHGIPVEGCDVSESSRVQMLRDRGIPVTIGHDPSHVRFAGTIVYSTDVPEDLDELSAARESGMAVLHRSRVLARLFEVYARGIAITGTHGKTSCTAMLGAAMEAAGKDPTVVVGGEMGAAGLTARVGASEFLVAEACESDGTFLEYRPWSGIWTNVEPEHLEHYEGSFDRQKEAFGDFISGIDPRGFLIMNASDDDSRSLAWRASPRIIWCGVEDRAEPRLGVVPDYSARSVDLRPDGSGFCLYRGAERMGRLRISVPGRHVVQNALMVAAAALETGAGFEGIARGLSEYSGVRRRFEIVGAVDGVRIVDDYAHHPTEVRATLLAARGMAGNGRVLAVFQPQRYTRTRDLMEEFGRAFDGADELILTPIYAPPGQGEIPGVSSDALAERVRRHSGIEVSVMADPSDMKEFIAASVSPGDVVITMGAGDIWKLARDLVKG